MKKVVSARTTVQKMPIMKGKKLAAVSLQKSARSPSKGKIVVAQQVNMLKSPKNGAAGDWPVAGESAASLLTGPLTREFEPTRLPIWREAFMFCDWLQLRLSDVYYGKGTQRGNGAPVVLVPGFLATDLYLLEMRDWLKRIGYRPYMSKIGRNADCPNLLVAHLLKTVEKAHAKTGQKVHLIGHSLGGVLSRIAASFRPDLIASVTMLGSPIRGIRVHPWVLSLSALVHHKIRFSGLFRSLPRPPKHRSCYTSACACGFACTWRGEFPATVPQVAIYTRRDGIVDWNMCMTNHKAVDVAVEGTHCGLVWNPEVYRVVAERLAAIEGIRETPRPVRRRAAKRSQPYATA